MYLLFSQENKKSFLIFLEGYLQRIFNHQLADASKWLPQAVQPEIYGSESYDSDLWMQDLKAVIN